MLSLKKLTFWAVHVLLRESTPAMTVIKQEDLIQSVADALQYISYYHPKDFIQAMHKAYEREESKAAKDRKSVV